MGSVSTIADLIAAVGNARAQGAANSGQIWGGALRGLGDLSADAYKQSQIAKVQQQEAALRAQQLASSQSQMQLAQNQDTREQGAFDAQRASQAQALRDATHQRMVQAMGAVRSAPDAAKPAIWGQVRAGIIGQGWAKPEDVPTSYPGDEAVDAELRGLMSAKEQWDVAHPKLESLPEGGSLVNPNSGAIVATGAPKTKSLQSKSVLLDGKPAEVNYDPAAGQFTVGGQDVSARVRPIPPASVQVLNAKEGSVPPGDWSKTGDDFLATVPVQWRKTVEKIAKYDEDPTKVASMRGGMRETLSQWINQVNPAYDQSKFAIRSSTRKAFTTGTQGQALNAINTGILHLDQLTGLADKLGNGSFTPGNKVWNDVSTIFGGAKVTNFDTLKDALAGEIAKSLNGGAATVDGIRDQRAKMNGYSSPEQLAGYVKTLIPTLGSKLANYNFQYHQAMGDEDSFSALSPEAKQILEKNGFDPTHPEISQGQGGAQSITKPIPGIPGSEATSTDGGKTWVRSK